MTNDKLPKWDGQETKHHTKIAIILDRSGSMGSFRDRVISTFNEQVDTIRDKAKEDGHEVTISSVTFSDKVQKVFFDVTPDFLTKLDRDSYIPRGMTALYDAIYLTVNELKKAPTPSGVDTAYLLYIITDGYENSSSDEAKRMVPGLLKDLNGSDNWTVLYAGTGHDVEAVTRNLNIPKGNTLQFAQTDAGYAGMSTRSSEALGTYMSSRNAGQTQCLNLFEESGDTTKDNSTD